MDLVGGSLVFSLSFLSAVMIWYQHVRIIRVVSTDDIPGSGFLSSWLISSLATAVGGPLVFSLSFLLTVMIWYQHM